jgi:hypothetical protein
MAAGGLERAPGMLLLDVAFCEGDALSRLSRAAIARFRELLQPSLLRRRKPDAALPRSSAMRRNQEEEP